jgi:hypothetical protein
VNSSQILDKGDVRPWLLRSIILLHLCLLSITGFAEPEASRVLTIYHYNPENLSGLNLILKNTFDRYFQSRHAIQLQPVEDRKTFQGLVTNSESNLFMMSDWHYRQLASSNRLLAPYLRGLKEGKDTYRKLLIGRPLTLQSQDNAQLTIAVSGSENYVNTVLKYMRYNSGTAPLAHPIYLKVPKDIDALLAVSFGLSDAALATENSFEKLSHLYQNEYQGLTILGESQPQKRLLVVVKSDQLPRVRNALDAIEAMDKSKEGRLCLNLLGLDNWQRMPVGQTSQGGDQ